MSNTTNEISLPIYIVKRIISLLSNPEKNTLECRKEAQALRRTLSELGGDSN